MPQSLTKPDADRIERDFGARALSVEPKTLNDEQRSVEAVIATETAVPMFDYERWEAIPEILLTDGMQLPSNRQVPLLNAHSRWSVGDVLGSVRDIRQTAGEVRARIYFAKAATDEYEKVREGHVTDMSAGYTVLNKTHVPKGQKQTIGGREYAGPVNVVTNWRLKEGSLVPIGADEMAKLRGYDPLNLRPRREDQQEWNMPPELRAFLESRGMPKELTDDQAREWADANKGKPEEKKPEPNPAETRGESAAEIAARAAKEAIDAYAAQQAKDAAALKAFKEEVRASCELAGVSDLSARFDSVVPMAEVRAAIIEERARRGVDIGHGINFSAGPAQIEKHRSAVGTALNMRLLGNGVCKPETLKEVFPDEQRSKDAGQFKYAGVYDIAVECLRMDGWNLRGMSREQIAICAMGFHDTLGIRAPGDPAAYHVTGSFPQLTRDAINKSMMVGYTEAPSTWRGPMRQGSSVSDFKTINRIRMGAVPNIPEWPDNSDPQALSFADARESYNVEAYSAELSFSYRLLVNDDMDALSRIPMQMGNAAARTINKIAWTVVTSNPTMSDSVALFSVASGARKRPNFTASGAAPSIAQVQIGTNFLMQMRGENTPEGNESDDVLSIQPRYIVGPGALSTTIKQLVLSAYDPSANAFQRYNTTTELIPIIEPLLDANSATAWYLFASPSQVDTIEVTFLQGQETPITRFDTNKKNLAQVYYILQSFGVKAMNHRGIYKDNGA